MDHEPPKRRSSKRARSTSHLVRASFGAAAIACAHLGCVGNLGDAADNGPATHAGVAVVTNRFPRLTHEQWELTVMDLFGLDAPTGLSASFSSDPLGGKVFDNDQSALQITPSLWRDYQSAAETVAADLTSVRRRHVWGAPGESPRAFIAYYGKRAFRRPLTDDEINARLSLFASGAATHPELDPFAAGVRVCIAELLQSPYFLYRPELDLEPSLTNLQPLNDWEIASRLSYAIWNSMPDGELFRAAEAGELSTPTGFHRQVERMLDAPRARASAHRFFDQLYQGNQYESLDKSPANTLFTPGAGIGHQMRLELGKFTDNVYANGGGLRELLTSTTTFVTPKLAELYGVMQERDKPSVLGRADSDGFSRLELDPTRRAGLLTLSGFLAWKGLDVEPNTIQRGVFINRRITCTSLPPPPPAAAGATFGDQPTDRERVNALTGPGTCGAGCHATTINPAGYAFEHYGAMGDFRTNDEGYPIDAAASYPFEDGAIQYDGAVEFSQALVKKLKVHACFTGYVVEYITGRGPVAGDIALANELANQSLAGASARDLFAATVESDAFRYPFVQVETP